METGEGNGVEMMEGEIEAGVVRSGALASSSCVVDPLPDNVFEFLTVNNPVWYANTDELASTTVFGSKAMQTTMAKKET